MLAAALFLALQAARPDSLLARAESLLAAGDLAAARNLAERLDRARPDDPRVLTLLGRIHLTWPTVGRFKADSLLTRAMRLDPDNPEPAYHLGMVGLALRGDDGEMIARRGLSRVLELEPLYRDAWTMWSGLYRGPAERRDAVAALSRHAGEPAPDMWRSQLLMELERYAEAETLLRALAARSPGDPAVRGLLAQLLYETGRDTEAEPIYSAAVADVASDTGSYLWRQVRSIASPSERREWGMTGPEGRASFLRLFWVVRRPDLTARVNERVGEHFRRLREAHRRYGLLHPNSLYHHSRQWRTWGVIFGGSPGPEVADIARLVGSEPRPRVPESLALTGELAPRDDGDRTWNLEDNLDDRGRVYVRYGRPDDVRVWNLGAETWRYRVPGGDLQVTFARHSGTYDISGDAVVMPFAAGETVSAAYLLASDRASAPADLAFRFWGARFRADSERRTELLLFVDSARATAVLVDAGGGEVARDTASVGPLRLAAAPGRYVLAVDAERSRQRGRYRNAIRLPAFSGDQLAVSGMLLTARPVSADRNEMARAAPVSLRVPAAAPLRFYAELYGLAVSGGVSRYEASYVFEHIPGRHAAPDPSAGRRTRIGFSREATAGPVTVESLVIDPGRFPAGRYRMRLEIRDVIAGARAASTSLEFELR